ncbi:hypothetical protein ABT112_28315 [Streptomyces sp. NPDC002055]|uniref:hypothetical protein n=1 Tax=Streptomyces sp. NPDC002055 TaxID=3154534 RepID=UPI00332AB4CC
MAWSLLSDAGLRRLQYRHGVLDGCLTWHRPQTPATMTTSRIQGQVAMAGSNSSLGELVDGGDNHGGARRPIDP